MMSELYKFLQDIAKANKFLGANFTYKISCKNRNKLPFEDIVIIGSTITGYLDTEGTRKYKSIEEFSYKVFLIKRDSWGRSFSVSKQ